MPGLTDDVVDRAQAGAAVRREVLGAAYVDASKASTARFGQQFIEFTNMHCWGNVWLRPGLDRRTRSILNLAMLSAMARWHEFEVHVRGAINNGVTPDEVAEVVLQAGVYAGIPIASEGLRRAGEVIDRIGREIAAPPNDAA